eukprot:TRINITY_DN26044_c0_g2_i2.p1 TRINITY_DN26044_c0_g2~~TRINITY_DN26044_c0_g2_i2.p1  ORF type:complete len:389 (-),score=63.64 TRINITY_DN26044_c0_g2_i2:263-1429(-)
MQVFAEATAALGSPFDSLTSCNNALTALVGGDVGLLCGDEDLAAAVQTGCKATCGLCVTPPPVEASANPAGDTAGEAGSSGNKTTDDGKLRVLLQVRTQTDATAAAMASKIEALKSDPVSFLQTVLSEMESAGYGESELPTSVWVTVEDGPKRELVNDGIVQAKRAAKAMSFGMIVILAAASVSTVLLSCIAVVAWYLWERRNSTEQVQPDTTGEREEELELVDGSYRLRKVKAGETGANATPPKKPRKPCCCVRLCRWVWRRCCRCCHRKYKRAELRSRYFGEAGLVTLGEIVMLSGLSQRQYNGLLGRVMGGPNEKGRFDVDVIVFEDHRTTEIKSMNFKADNLRPALHAPPSPDMKTSAAASAARSGGGSYRANAAAGGGSYRTK